MQMTENFHRLNVLKLSSFVKYRQVYHSKILHGARFAFNDLYGSKSRQRPLLYTSLTDWFLYPLLKVFTVRYGLIPYIKQITFRPLKFKIKLNCKYEWLVSRCQTFLAMACQILISIQSLLNINEWISSALRSRITAFFIQSNTWLLSLVPMEESVPESWNIKTQSPLGY
jgi:hypothetical protein